MRKEVLKQASAKWKEDNREKHLAYNRQYSKEHRDNRLMANRRWYARHRAEQVQRVRRYQIANPDVVNTNLIRRKVRKSNAEGSHTTAEWLAVKAQFNYKCVGCLKQEPEIKLTRDHIIPLSKGGSNYISNIQPLCVECNCKKYNKMPTLTE